MIEFSGEFLDKIGPFTGNIISQLWPVVAMLLGLSVAFFVLRKVVDLFKLAK